MAALQLGDIESFPFLDPPEQRSIRDGVQLLQELGAFDASGGAITEIGRRLAQLPVDPRLARMIVQADTEAACARCWCSPPRCRYPTLVSDRPTVRKRRGRSMRGSPTSIRTSYRS